MVDRRHATRFQTAGTNGFLTVIFDVQIESTKTRDLVALSTMRPPVGEQVLYVRNREGYREQYRVDTTQSRLASCEGVIRHRLSLRMTDHSMATDAIEGCAPIAVLTCRIGAHVANVSTAGCLIDVPTEIGPGAVALLERSGHHLSAELVRVCRCGRVPGTSLPWRVGVEFLPLDVPLHFSLRNTAARLETALPLPVHLSND